MGWSPGCAPGSRGCKEIISVPKSNLHTAVCSMRSWPVSASLQTLKRAATTRARIRDATNIRRSRSPRSARRLHSSDRDPGVELAVSGASVEDLQDGSSPGSVGKEGALALARSRPWHRLRPIWEAAESVAMARGMMNALASPAWRVMLLSDGSVTRHLQLLTDITIQVECLEQADVAGHQDLPEAVALIPGPLVQRQVFLVNSATKQRLVYATSWWSKEDLHRYMRESDAPIWVNLQSKRAELYRSIERIYLGHNPILDREFNAQGDPLWGRHYVFFHEGRPLTVIYEVFSNSLEEYLGPTSKNLHRFATGNRDKILGKD